ncbi:disease resistance protein RPP13-like [Rhododendron vialii]|uniref:disease resistance protein RPP13-like n=1 Tax=Rhododendron vialii TaxID=182163 RepID=UPI00265D709B|nr:disease resistance protein RPP13-like [Rhododendron vialii]
MGKLHDIGEVGRLEIISIVGASGGSKTTLAREVYDHPLMSQKFEIRAWVNVSQDYDKTMKRHLLIRILESAFLGKYEDYEEISEDKLGEKVYKCLQDRKYLIVMDDIWGIEAWNDIQRSSLGTARGVKSCSLVDYLFNLIASVVSLIQWKTRHSDVWEKVAKHLSSTIAKNQEGCMEILELSYNHIPLHLKACFLYIGAHPKGYEIPVCELIWLWIAEGFIQQSDGGKSLEAIAEDYLIGLIDRSLVMVARKSESHGGIKACSIHDLLRELCLKKAEEDNFFVKIYEGDYFSPSTTNNRRHLFFGH